MRRIRSRITFSNVTALIALFVALGGSVYAANKINGKRIKKASMPANRIVPNTVKGRQVRESALGQVPRAAVANSAGSANSAGVANAAFALRRPDAVNMPDAFGTIETLSVPEAGGYVINAKLVAFASTAGTIFNGTCRLVAGEIILDRANFDVEASGVDDTEAVVLHGARSFSGPNQVVLECQDDDGTDVAQALDTWISAIQVRSLNVTDVVP